MARSRTLLQLRTRIRELADCNDSGTRHPSSVLNTWINESWQALRSMVTAKGDLTYVANATTSTGVGPDTGKAYGLLALPATAVLIHAIDLTFAADDIRSLWPVSFNDRNEFHSRGVLTDTPVNFAVFNVGVESGASVGNGWIALMPAPDRVYQVTIYYLPAWTDITNDAYVFDGHDGWDDWVAYDVVLKIAMKDNDMQQCAQIAMQMQAKAEERVLASCNSLQRVAPSYGRDTARQRRMSGLGGRRQW